MREEIRKRMEEFFTYDGVPRRIEEAMAVCERELDERICSMRMTIGASTPVRDLEVVGDSFRRAGDVRRWKKAVSEAMEERIKRRNLMVDRMIGREGGWTVRLKMGPEGEKSARIGGLRRASRGCVTVAEKGAI